MLLALCNIILDGGHWGHWGLVFQKISMSPEADPARPGGADFCFGEDDGLAQRIRSACPLILASGSCGGRQRR